MLDYPGKRTVYPEMSRKLEDIPSEKPQPNRSEQSLYHERAFEKGIERKALDNYRHDRRVVRNDYNHNIKRVSATQYRAFTIIDMYYKAKGAGIHGDIIASVGVGLRTLVSLEKRNLVEFDVSTGTWLPKLTTNVETTEVIKR